LIATPRLGQCPHVGETLWFDLRERFARTALEVETPTPFDIEFMHEGCSQASRRDRRLSQELVRRQRVSSVEESVVDPVHVVEKDRYVFGLHRAFSYPESAARLAS